MPADLLFVPAAGAGHRSRCGRESDEWLASLALSPDGRWIAYTNRSEPSVFVTRFPAWPV